MDTSSPSPKVITPGESRPSSRLRRPRRTIERFVLALLAGGLGLFGQSLFARNGIWEGLLFYLPAVVLFVAALWPVTHIAPPWITPYRGLFARLRLAGPWRQLLGATLTTLAVLSSVLGMQAFQNAATASTAWFFYGVSLGLGLGGVFLAERFWRDVAARLPRLDVFFSDRYLLHPHTLLLIAILSLGLALRLWQFDSLPFGVWYDEAEAGLQARFWLNDPTYRPAFYDNINVSGQFLWLYSLGLRFISDSVHGLRAISVMFGMGGIVLAYLLGRELRGPEFGLLMAFFMAVMRWDINFSRIAMTGIDTPFFILLSLFLLARLLRHGRLHTAAGFGLALGAGLSFYTAFRLFGLALGIALMLAIIIWPQWRGRLRDINWLLPNALRLSLALLMLLLTVMPVAQYAITHPDSFSLRVQTISIFNRRDNPDLQAAVRDNLIRHVQMFHITGDRNGRHNLPGEPMLDPLMGVLFLFGLGLGLRELFSPSARPETLLFLLLIPTALLGGVLSVDFEAPQSLRSIAALPAVAYFAALAALALLSEARRVLQPLPPRWWSIPAGVLALGMIGFNAHTYFVRQANDFAVWNAFSTAESITGRKMQNLGPGYDIYLSALLLDHPTIRFLAPDVPRPQVLRIPNAMPLLSDGSRPAAVFISAEEPQIYNEARYFYPNAEFEIYSNRPDGPPSVHSVVLSAADLAALQGLSLLYWPGTEIRNDQVPLRALKVPQIAVDWRDQPPLDPPFVAQWQGVLHAPDYGIYEFQLLAPDEASLTIDGVTILEGEGNQRVAWELPRGYHSLQVMANAGPGPVQLLWTRPFAQPEPVPPLAFYTDPVTNNGLLGRYYPNETFTGPPVLVQIDPFLDTYFHLTPLPRPYSVHWRGYLQVPQTGVYRLGLQSVGQSELRLGQTTLLQTTVPNEYLETSLPLQTGLHEIDVRFVDNIARSQIRLYWGLPDGPAGVAPIPRQNLWPTLDTVTQSDLTLAETAPSFEAAELTFRAWQTLEDGILAPRAVTTDAARRIYVVDSEARAVLIYAEGQLVDRWEETPDGPFLEPFAIATDSENRIWVLDSVRQWAYAFTTDGQVLRQIGGPEAFLYFPRGLQILQQPGAADVLALADTGSGRLVFFDLQGQQLNIIGIRGDGPGQFNEPIDLLQDDFGRYYVVEGNNINRWQRLDSLGRPLNVWPLDTPDAINGSRMAWLPDGSLLISQSDLGIIHRFSPEGVSLGEWRGLDGVDFLRPQGVFVDSSRNWLIVTDLNKRQVQVFEFEVFAPVEIP